MRASYGALSIALLFSSGWASIVHADGTPPRKLGPAELAAGMSFSADGKTLVVSSWEETIHVFGVASGNEVRLITPSRFIRPLAIAPDGNALVGGTYSSKGGGALIVFDPSSGKELRQLTGHAESLAAIAFSPDGKTLASGGSDGTIRLWDTATWKALRTIVSGESGAKVNSPIIRDVAFSPDGTQVVGVGFCSLPTGGPSNIPLVRVWDVASGTLAAEMQGHTDLVLRADFAPDGRTLFTVSSDRSVRAWDVATGKELRRIDSAEKIYGAGFSPDRKTIVIKDGVLRFFDSATFRQIYTAGDPAIGHDIARFAFSPDGKRLATDGDDDNIVYLWDLAAR
jgi:WD40 repeat protein